MKRIINMVLIMVLCLSTFAFASDQPFELTQNGDEFTITLDKESYDWTYFIKKSDHVQYISKTSTSNTVSYKFKVLSDGVSVIDFKVKDELNVILKELPILVYKNGDKVYVEEDKVVKINDVGAIRTLVPAVSESSSQPFTTTQDGNFFTITLNENPSTGYTWYYAIKDEALVKFISDDYLNESTLIGAPGKHTYKFEVLKNGVTSIDFELKRASDVSGETLSILVYKTEDKLIIEENQVIIIDDGAMLNKYDLIEINGQQFLPVAEVLRNDGYEVIWHGDTFSVEISKQNKWTEIFIDKNSYSKNKMAPIQLSSAPIIMDGTTFVPVEFFSQILDHGIRIFDGQVSINYDQFTTYQGTIINLETVDTKVTLHLSTDGDETVDVVIHLDKAIIQRTLKENDKVTVMASIMTTRSIPPQTNGYIVY